MLKLLSKHAPSLVGLLLIYAGLYKAVHPGESTVALMAVMEAGPTFCAWAVAALTVVELYVGCILLFKWDIQYALRLATVVILLFSLFLFYLSTMANPPSCGCLGLTGAFHSNRQNALAGLVRNCLLLWLLRGASAYYEHASLVAGGEKR